jgi:hypothetical protein
MSQNRAHLSPDAIRRQTWEFFGTHQGSDGTLTGSSEPRGVLEVKGRVGFAAHMRSVVKP